MKKKVNVDKKAMELGYEAMANINLTIAQEDFHLETEGERLNEMDTTKTEGKAQ